MAIEAQAKSGPLSDIRPLAFLKLIRLEYWLLGAILLTGLAVRAYFYFGLVKVDPFTYADGAASIARWEPVYDSDITGSVYYTQYIRLALIVPAALLYRIFGISDAASTAWPIALSLAMGVLAFLGGRRLAGTAAGVVAAAAVCAFPLNVINSTQFLPDIVVAAFSGSAIIAFVFATEDDCSRRRRFWLFVGAGASLALACYARPTAVSLLPGMAMLIVARRRFGLEAGGLALGAVAVLVLAQALLLSLGGSLFEDIRVVRAESDTALHFRLDYARIFLTDRMFWPYFAAAGIGLAMWTWRRGAQSLYTTPAFAFVVLIASQYIYTEFFMSLPAVQTWWKEPRYALPIAFPVLILGSAGLVEGLRPLLAGRRALTTGVIAAGIALLALASIPPIADEYDFYMQQDGNRVDFDQKQLAAAIPEDGVVYAHDDDFARPLSYRLGVAGTLYERLVSEDGRLHPRLDTAGESQVTPGSYVVILPREEWWPLVTAPDPAWELVMRTTSGVGLYRVPDSWRSGGASGAAPAMATTGVRTVRELEEVGPTAGATVIRAPYLSIGAGVIGAPGHPLDVPIDALAPGDYWVEVRAYDYGAGENTIDIELNGVVRTATWGAGSGKGDMARVGVFIPAVPAGASLRIRPVTVGQEAMILDAVVVSDREPPR